MECGEPRERKIQRMEEIQHKGGFLAQFLHKTSIACGFGEEFEENGGWVSGRMARRWKRGRGFVLFFFTGRKREVRRK